RSISAQKLALSPEQYLRVRDHLLETVQPENRDYLYDYFTDNCSTRVRDVIDLALDGALSGHFTQRPARLNFREQTRRLTAMDFWYYLGLEAGLGSPVDRPRDRWEEMFIPGVLADSLVGLSLAETAGPAAGERLLLYASSRAEPAADPPDVWSRYLLLGILLAAAAWASGRFLSTVLGEGLLLAWALLAGTAGCVLAGLWGLTDHHAAGSNVNLLLFLPLALLAPLRAPKKVVAVLMLAATVTAAMLALVPGGQYNLDVLAFAAPLNLVCSALLWRGPALFGQR
nr:DUF4105 domain-containing protein [Xanthomonadales bacterium]NIX13993.1 DUF4105 domain-containing protein [Xanthomonadales bacterium]